MNRQLPFDTLPTFLFHITPFRFSFFSNKFPLIIIYSIPSKKQSISHLPPPLILQDLIIINIIKTSYFSHESRYSTLFFLLSLSLLTNSRLFILSLVFLLDFGGGGVFFYVDSHFLLFFNLVDIIFFGIFHLFFYVSNQPTNPPFACHKL